MIQWFNKKPGGLRSSAAFSRFAGISIAALCVPSAHAAGLWLYEQGTPDVGTATAGMAARADDAATAFANPAGMTRLKGSQAMIGIQPIYGDFKFDTESSTFGGGSGGNGVGWVPSGGLFYVHDAAEDTKLGVSAGSYLGLGLDFNDNWAGRYYMTKNELVTAFVQGSVGHRISDNVSIGAGAGVVYGKLEYRAALNNLPDARPDGSIKFDDSDVAFTYNFGLLIEPREDTRIGVTYISEIDLEFEDSNKFRGAGPILDGLLGLSGLRGGDTELEFTLPKQVMLSVHHDLTDDLAIMGNIGWQNWSEFGDVGVSLSDPNATTLNMDANMHDTWHYAIGARYRIDPVWSVSAGFAYDDSPVSNKDRTVAMPLDQQKRYAVGLQYKIRNDLTVGAAYEYMDAGDAPVNQNGGILRGNYSGELDRSDFHFFALNFNWTL
jgi:long-chain fatty acid transport protein